MVDARSGGMADGEDLWIFGYGSLLWRPDFPHSERVCAEVRGWSRRFWQGSTDHRGVPGAPGRVVTLVADPEAECAGIAYRVDAAQASEVLAGLDHRERGGFERLELVAALGFRPSRSVGAITYVAPAPNPNYLGPAPDAEIASQIRGAHGPSGANLEYLFELAEALRRIDARDPHVFALESLARKPLAAGSGASSGE